jgi:hypothetical protein
MTFFASAFRIIAAVALAGCASRRDSHPGGCVTQHKLPSLRLTSDHKRLLTSVSSDPRTALDYYMLLPRSYFGIMPDSRERRVSYITRSTLSDEYLDAWGHIECTGGFHVTLKLYRTPSRTFIVIEPYNEEIIFGDGNWEISIVRPSLWAYAEGEWTRQPDESIPKISPRHVLTKYHRNWDDAQRETDQKKFIEISYNLSPATNAIILMGRETFQPKVYEYARLKWRNTRFSFK